MDSPGTHRRVPGLAIAGLTLAAADTLVYLAVLANEGDRLLNPYSVMLLVALVVAATGVVALNPKGVTAGAVILALLGVLGIFSIGLPLLLAAALLWMASSRLP